MKTALITALVVGVVAAVALTIVFPQLPEKFVDLAPDND